MGTLLKHHIAVKTDHWNVTEPGFPEADLSPWCYSNGLRALAITP